MPFQATVIPVMIASPGDVYEEREVIRDVIHTWNYIHSVKTKIVLIPAGWETHSSPELGDRPQELINSRVLKDCDILIGVFWTRIGSPTGEFVSGTVEEIEKHAKAGKPALIYFSSKPAALQSFNAEQFQSLKEFKEKCKSWGLIYEFENILEFKDKVLQHIQQCMNNNPYMGSILANASSPSIPIHTSPEEQTKFQLSSEAITLLKAASSNTNGTILKIAVLGGRFIQAGGQTFGGQGGRESAKWERALNELIVGNLVVSRGYKNEVFELSDQGWQLADTIKDSD